jgi:hypothetical protein
VAEQARKAEAPTAALGEEKQDRLAIMAIRAQAEVVMKMSELLGEAKTDVVVGATSSSSVTS